MDQDLSHRISVPSRMAGGRARYSLVWKLLFVPRRRDQTACIARPEWGPAQQFGSAAGRTMTMTMPPRAPAPQRPEPRHSSEAGTQPAADPAKNC
jgi:hypothetical protein